MLELILCASQHAAWFIQGLPSGAPVTGIEGDVSDEVYIVSLGLSHSYTKRWGVLPDLQALQQVSPRMQAHIRVSLISISSGCM